MINYIIQVLVFQTLFLIVYDIFLKKETFFQWNRFYLIVSSLLAYAIPLFKIKRISHYVQQEFTLPTVVLNPKTIFINEKILSNQTVQTTTSFDYFTLENLYFLGLLLMSILFLLKIRQLITKIKSNKVIKNSGYKLVVIKNDTHAFSFFNYIFLGEAVYKKDYKTVLKHELIHVKQKHSFDLLFFEIQKIICWFNPFSYIFQRRISVLHEYIADEKNHSKKDNKAFFESLLYQTFNVENISFVNNYYKKSLLKKRIIMATKNKSKELLKMKYLLVLPILLLMFIYANAIEYKSNDSNLNYNDTFKLAVNDSLTPIIIPFKSIEKTPIFPSCDPLETEYQLKTCFVNNIFVHTHENFNAKGLQNIGLSPGSKRVHVRFVIDTEGNVSNIVARAPHPKLQEEAIRTIQLLPQMKPGMQNGKKVSVQYTLPIIFKIEGETTEESNIVTSTNEVNVLPFSKINQTPVFPGCESLQNEQEKKDCFTKKITQHVSKNFNTKAMKETGLPSGRKRISVQFIIDNNGNINDIKARAPHPKLIEEAIRTINLLPKMKPGIDESGKKVNVRYNLPIVFNLETDKNHFGSSKGEFNNVEYIGTIRDEYGYLLMTKKAINVSTVGIMSFDSKAKFKVTSFSISIDGKKVGKYSGNKINLKLAKLINTQKIGTIIKIYNIKGDSKNKLINIEPINIKIKD